MAKLKDSRGNPPDRPSDPPHAGAASGKFRIAVAIPPDAELTPKKRKKSARGRFAGKLARSASACLERALEAKTPASRARHAREGLVSLCDVETQGLLLRQLYRGELEGGQFERARAVAEQLVSLGVLPDVARHDAARACQALGALDDAIVHLREAVRVAPEGRRGFHLSTLGSLLYLAGHAREALGPLEDALATKDAADVLVRGQLALARFAAGLIDGAREDELDLAYHELVHDRSGEGYGRFVLGELAFARGDRQAAQLYLQAFLARVRRSRPAAQAALAPEVARAQATLGRITLN